PGDAHQLLLERAAMVEGQHVQPPAVPESHPVPLSFLRRTRPETAGGHSSKFWEPPETGRTPPPVDARLRDSGWSTTLAGKLPPGRIGPNRPIPSDEWETR